jgi:hypothetical protein
MMEESLYAWQVYDTDERWGIIAAVLPGVTTAAVPLVFRERRLADYARGTAHAHAVGTDRPVRLARYTHAETLETANVHQS